MSAIYNFEWDPAKAKANLGKHGISFEQATSVFRDPKALTLFDEEHSDNEDRWITLEGRSERISLSSSILSMRSQPTNSMSA